MAKYQSGQKIIQQRLEALQREMDALKSATPVYDVEQKGTYGKCLAALHEAYAQGKAGLQPLFVKADGSSIVRPLTFEETIDAIVNAYESGNRELITHWNDSCTGIQYKGNTTKFKVVPVSKELVFLDHAFNSTVVSASYAEQDGVELDVSKGKYDEGLTKGEVLKNPGWNESVRDKALLRAFRDIVFNGRGTDTAMGYYVKVNPEQDHVRALAVCFLVVGSDAFVRNYRYFNARFVRVSPK